MPKEKKRHGDPETGLGEVGENLGEGIENTGEAGIEFFSEIGRDVGSGAKKVARKVKR